MKTVINSDENKIYNSATKAHPEFINTQFQKAADTFRFHYTLLVQIYTVLAIVNATIIGFAFSQKLAGILFVGAPFPIVFLFILVITNKLVVPSAYTAVTLEKRFSGNETDWLVSTSIATLVSKEAANKLCKIALLESQEERINALKSLSIPLLGTKITKIAIIILVLEALAHLALPFLLSYFFNWEFF